MLNSIIAFLSGKPIVGAGISGGSFVTGFLLRMGVPSGLHHIINDCLQTAAFTITLIVGVLTIISWFRKNKKS